jgi:hypothetical protein
MKPLNRPMFQRGGKVSSRNNGIVSGFENGGRVGYEPGGAVGYLEEMGLFEEPQRQSGLSTADYLRIASAGADIMGAQPTGRSGFIGALQAASPSLGSLGRDLASSSAAKEADYQAKLAANRKLQAGAALSDFERGGRVGLQEGGDPMMAQQAQAQPQSNSVGLTFEELRARLPQEVTDGVVRLLATSEEALLAFANLETQEDIAQFNQKYNTDLQLPAQVA